MQPQSGTIIFKSWEMLRLLSMFLKWIKDRTTNSKSTTTKKITIIKREEIHLRKKSMSMCTTNRLLLIKRIRVWVVPYKDLKL